VRLDARAGGQVFVGNLPPEAEARDLRDFFRDFGQINDAWVARKPPGFGFVWFDDERDAVLSPAPGSPARPRHAVRRQSVRRERQCGASRLGGRAPTPDVSPPLVRLRCPPSPPRPVSTSVDVTAQRAWRA